MADKVLIFTATYNELGNISNLVAEVLKYADKAQMLVIDDGSPDGTGHILDGIAKKQKRLKVIHRSGKQGLGSAHIAAMRYAVENKYDLLITMDADFSHDPADIPKFITLSQDNDFVIGSRYTKGGGLGYGLLRTFISKTANFLARLLLSIKLKECTTSFRAFRAPLLEKLLASKIESTGYSFFFEITYRVTRLTDRVTEFPIYFADRVAGESKISKQEIFRGMTTLLRLFVKRFA